MGKHPGDFISSLMLSASTSSSSPIGHNTVLKDVLDQRLPPPEIIDKFFLYIYFFSKRNFTSRTANYTSSCKQLNIASVM